MPFHEWQYVFDEETFPLGALSAIGVAANNAGGVTTVTTLDTGSGRLSKRRWNSAPREVARRGPPEPSPVWARRSAGRLCP